MALLVIAYLGGMLTIISPCILPVLPFVFARFGQTFVKSTLPMLTGMALTFAVVATLAAVGGSWAVHANIWGRYLALAFLAVFGLALISPAIAARLTAPVVALGNRLSQPGRGPGQAQTFDGAFLFGIATGLLWAPCAGPILGLVLTGAALHGANPETTLLLLAYAAGAATSLAGALIIGGRVLAAMKWSLGASEWGRRGLGAAVLAGVVAIALGADTGFLAQASSVNTGRIEQALLDAAGETPIIGNGTLALADNPAPGSRSNLPVEGSLPTLGGANEWLNSAPLTREQLRGKVVLVNFWTYSCINCIRTLPYVRAWAEKYKDQGLVVIGVHTPEFAFEKQIGNIKKALVDLKVSYPVAVDNNYKVWQSFSNHYWPALYLVDAEGRIRYHHFGEGNQSASETAIQALLAEAGKPAGSEAAVPDAKGAQAAPDLGNIRSGETYIGYEKAENFASQEWVKSDSPRDYTAAELRLNQWALAGNWTVGSEAAALNRAGGAIAYRFSARDLHLILGPAGEDKPVRFQVTIDGKAPGDSHGADTDAEGNGIVTQTRLYQLVRQAGGVEQRNFEIRFLDPGARAYAFTFG